MFFGKPQPPCMLAPRRRQWLHLGQLIRSQLRQNLSLDLTQRRAGLSSLRGCLKGVVGFEIRILSSS